MQLSILLLIQKIWFAQWVNDQQGLNFQVIENYEQSGKTIKGRHDKPCCCIFSFPKLISLVDKNGSLLKLWEHFWEKRAFTTECYFLKIKQKSTTLMGKQLKGLMASHVVALFSFPKLLSLVDKNA